MSLATLDPAAADAPPRSAWFSAAIGAALEAQHGRSFLWSAPTLSLGIGTYFALGQEPGTLLLISLAAAGAVLFWLGRVTGLLLLAGLVLWGFALAGFQSWRSATPLLAFTTGEVAVTGRAVSVDRSSRTRLVMILAPEQIGGIAPERLPKRLRLTLPESAGATPPGALVTFKARLAPLPSPVAPGAFDYGRSLWLDGIGGTGRVTSQAIEILDNPRTMMPLESWLSAIRAAMGARIHAALAEPYASFAEALITGERSSIPPEINKSLLISGLYHILSISGLHMWLAAGSVFWAVRAVLALAPGLALRFPIRKWAAAAALLMGLFYMLLAQGGTATARSFLMVAIVFFAVIVDRPALSMRNLALAAVVILVLDPQAAIEASFQMSFLAVLGLVAFYEAWARWRADRGAEEGATPHWSWRLARWAAAAFIASLVTSLIAGFSSSLPAAYHFGRISPYGVLANGLAIPVVGVLVMPFALLAVLLMPFGLEELPLAVMGKGLELVIAISNGVAALPGANEVIARPPLTAMVVMVSGMVLLCLLAGPVRLAGLAVMALGALLMLSAPPPPDLLIEATGANVALRDAAGHLVPAQPRRARFAVEKWLQANGEEVSLAEAAKRAGWTCSHGRCAARVRGRAVVYLAGGEGKPLNCKGMDVLIADFPLRGACRSVTLRIDRFDLWRHGAHAIDLSGPGPLVTTARGAQGRRPWVVVPQPRQLTEPAVGSKSAP
ncbi:MAG: ComEC family competence protein [Aestuariivirga sp.]|uniref:ComEC/Rec2 family competence protein n=1 Tax=Aestuariivirga sp. TaxID=2650926 RepID=UPI0025B83F9B|nr:ComEC/Rec2 family competence protein [Aestuariivirga sp.]MCA3562561.1 ComEC family competence protein [Aestuariivirga sp.]